jgi:YHS domain-containing protein
MTHASPQVPFPSASSPRSARRRLWLAAAASGALLLLAAGGFAAYLGRERPPLNLSSDGLALSGYDPVSYFPEGGGAPQPGSPQYSSERDGRRYQFASEQNRARFEAQPERYEPAFGGWCAYAVANGYKFEVDPLSYRVADDRLLLFYRGWLGDAHAEFEKEGVAEGLSRADANWPQLAVR